MLAFVIYDELLSSQTKKILKLGELMNDGGWKAGLYLTCGISCEAFCIWLFLLGLSFLGGASLFQQSVLLRGKFSEKC